MESSIDKQWASKYILDPLTAPAPSEETGPGTHYTSTFRPADAEASDSSPLIPRKGIPAPIDRSGNAAASYPSPPHSAGPRQEQFSPGKTPVSGKSKKHSHRTSIEGDNEATSSSVPNRRRVSSLSSRFPGDQSHRPLEMLKHDAALAHRAPHLRKKHLPGPDTIDGLDTTIGGPYHHEGPFDATLLARNTSNTISPIQAVRDSNAEALKATPEERIKDSVERHRPLDDVAIVPPGVPDKSGRVYQYEEGTDLMIEEGNFKRWPGVQYVPEDLKGKGEPSYTIEKALKEQKQHRRMMSDGNSGIEMTSRPTSSDGATHSTGYRDSEEASEGGPQRSNTTGRKASGTITRKFGSLRRRHNN